LEREGDREYIAPEVLESQKYDKPVDIFALGLTIVEAAGNEALPPNGPEWQRLRSGDISVAPILSTSSSGELVVRDDEGNPISTVMLGCDSPSGIDDPNSSKSLRQRSNSQRSARASRMDPALLHRPRPGDLVNPPSFMVEGGLEEIVEWMISADPARRPTVSQLLEAASLRWVDSRRRAPATIFEGLWGPDDSLVHSSDDDDSMVWESQTPDGGVSLWA
jgi:mitosis inhibitor protein kinase SWE1